MISSKKELKFFMMADSMMNRGYFEKTFRNWLLGILYPDYIMKYLRCMRCYEYYKNVGGVLDRFLSIIYANSFRRLGIKLGFSISNSEIGYGLVIPHYGTIVIGGGNRIKEYCVLHTCTCITAGHKEIGKGFYLSTGAKVVHDITINDYVSVGANSLVNKDINDSNVMIAGCPARIIKKSDEWYIRDGKEFQKRMLKCEELKNLFNLDEN